MHTAIETTALFVQQHVKGAIIVNHVTPPHGGKWLLYRMIVRTATVALPTAASPGFISGEVGISAALDAFSTVYELPLSRFKKGQTDKQTDIRTRTITIPRYALRPREAIMSTDACLQFSKR